MDSRPAGLLIVIFGIAVVVIGALVLVGAFGWFGRLPGDLRLERANVRIYVPIVSMLVVSVLLSLLLALLRRWF